MVMYRQVIATNTKHGSMSSAHDDDDAHARNRSAGDAADPMSYIADMREYDVQYLMRVSIDLELRVGAWFVVKKIEGSMGSSVEWQRDMMELCEPK